MNPINPPEQHTIPPTSPTAPSTTPISPNATSPTGYTIPTGHTGNYHSEQPNRLASSPLDNMGNKFNSFKTSLQSGIRKLTNDPNMKFSNQKTQKLKKPNNPAPVVSLFGMTVSAALEYNNEMLLCNDLIPRIAYNSMKYIEAKGLDEMGIYRVSGSTKDIGEIKLAFDTYYDVDLLQMMPDTNAVASLFKQYVRELPECLLTFQLEPQFIALFAHYTDSDLQFPESLKPTDPHPVIQDQNLIMGLKQLIEKLPTCNRDFLGMFMHHLSKISRNSNVNKMTRSNLLLVWSPTLRFGGACLTVMVILCELLFPISHISEPVKTKLNTKRSAPSVKVNNIKTGSSKPVPISASDTQRAAAQLSKSEPELSSPTVQYPGGRRPSKHNLVMIPARQSSKEKQVSTSWNEMIDYDDQETSKPRKTGTADLVDFFNESRIEKPIKAISSSNIDQKSVNSSSKSPLNSDITAKETHSSLGIGSSSQDIPTSEPKKLVVRSGRKQSIDEQRENQRALLDFFNESRLDTKSKIKESNVESHNTNHLPSTTTSIPSLPPRTDTTASKYPPLPPRTVTHSQGTEITKSTDKLAKIDKPLPVRPTDIRNTLMDIKVSISPLFGSEFPNLEISQSDNDDILGSYENGSPATQ